MDLEVNNYLEQRETWPQSGKHIMAQYDESSVVVYQAYRPVIGEFAAEYQFFGGPFSYTRMSWIKPNFLWMMYRSGWGTKQGQEVILAITLKREYFERILSAAVVSSFCSCNYETNEQWKRAVASSNVRLQWDPDHDPFGHKEERRAIQLGLRNDFLAPFKGEGIIKIENVSDFVSQQQEFVLNDELEKLMMPKEKPYIPSSSETRKYLGIVNED
ncbi:MAG: DUF4291 domain-containing protein [Kangiellaceae bacterium]|nr:DUF4291 domain-containing protein [Kangiellaceae bacterium]